MAMPVFREFLKGLWKENPVLVLVLGMCPTLATTSNASSALGMGLATTFVLAGSNLVISMIRNIVPPQIRIPCYIVVIATFVTVADFLLQAYAPAPLYKSLGIFIPLIVVNCIVLGRAEAFASKNGMLSSFADGLGMGAGFTLALVAMGSVREFISAGALFQVKIITVWETAFSLVTQPPGGFMVLGCFLALMNYLNMRKARKTGNKFCAPLEFDCRHCSICKIDGK
jgi:electron transport complex protein RnfE